MLSVFIMNAAGSVCARVVTLTGDVTFLIISSKDISSGIVLRLFSAASR